MDTENGAKQDPGVLADLVLANLNVLLDDNGDEDEIEILTSLAFYLLARFEDGGQMADLERAINLLRKFLITVSLDHPDRPMSLSYLAEAFELRFNQLGSTADLEEAMTLHRKALALHPRGHPDHSASLKSLASALLTRFDELGPIADLEEAVALHREALALHPPDHPDHSASLKSLASALLTQFDELGSIADLEEAVTLHRETLALHPLGHPDRSTSLNDVASTLLTRFRQLGSSADLEEAVALQRDALVLTPPGHPDRSRSLNNLALALKACFNQLGSIADLEEAIVLNREALDLHPLGDVHRSISLNILASALERRFNQLGSMADLEEAVTLNREGLALHPLSRPDRSKSLNNLATTLLSLFRQLGSVVHLEEAIVLHREALALRPLGHPDRSASLGNLALAVRERFDQLGSVADLEEAITLHREALALRDLDHPDLPISVNNLACAIQSRFHQLGSIADLDEAIMLHREALVLRPVGHPHRSMSLNNLALAVEIRFGKLGSIADLEEAVALHREALGLFPCHHPDRSKSLTNLGSAVLSRFDKLGSIADLEEALTLHREALALYLDGHPERWASLNNLASAVQSRFNLIGSIVDLEEVLALYHEAQTSVSVGSPQSYQIYLGLARAHFSHFQMTSIPEDISTCFASYGSAASAGSSKDRFLAAMEWVSMARELEHDSLLDACACALSLLESCLITRPNLEAQHHYLSSLQASSLASDAAADAIELGQLEKAVEFLEQGRAIIWSRLTGLRQPVEDLRNVRPDLAERFLLLTQALEAISITLGSLTNTNLPAIDERVWQQHSSLSRDLDTLVTEIRSIDQFHDFLMTHAYSKLRHSAEEGPVIILNVSKYRSDAIIIRSIEDPLLVPLSDSLYQQREFLLGKHKASRKNASEAASDRFRLELLRELWNLVVHPIAISLSEIDVKMNSRIWWCPTSFLCGLPLHAAGPYRPQERGFTDLYVSSYTTTLSSLIKARSSATIPDEMGLLLVGTAVESIPRVHEELVEIQQIAGVPVQTLSGSQANAESTIAALQTHPWVHFACHGKLDPRSPFHSYFKVDDNQQLSVLHLLQAHLPHAQLAVLSACHSAEMSAWDQSDDAEGGLERWPDEAVHLASTLQFCGFRSVVGTLSAMNDADGPELAKDFYKYMFRDQGGRTDYKDAAMALAAATREMCRRRVGYARWSLFVHFGA